MAGGGIALDAFGAFAKQFSDNPKILNLLGNTSPISKRALNREIASNSPFAINATNALRAGNFKEFHRLSEETVAVHAKNASMNRMSKIQNPTNNEALENLRYPRYQVDETLSFKEQKRQFKKQIGGYINEQWAAGNKIDLPVAYKKIGQLIDPETQLPVHLKYKKTDPKTGLRSYEPKPQATTAREVAKRRGRERPWSTNKEEIEKILEAAGKKEKLAELLTLMRTEYNTKLDSIKQAGMSKGHMKSLDNGGLDIAENIEPEPLRTIGDIPGNAARSSKKDLPDAALRKQGAFTGTLEEYILMKLKQLE
tara:strand:+ start:159 stop:1088 length:930 start_codon:yes stop_codon:yes gene_type:complete